MILAGGQGSRLGALTGELAKPAVPFGGKYRIIDFPMSNCANSGITTVGVLTQYRPLELNTYLSSGQPWDMDQLNGGVYVLPPYMTGKSGEWYKGTANAIYQNLRFLEQFSPEHVLILSGDHIYKMDYRRMLEFHQQAQAALTVAVFNVPLEEAGRYGILSADGDGRIYDFTEKPAHPTSTLASMGVYIFRWDALKEYLQRDEEDPKSQNDFGKNVIPAMLHDGCPIYAYSFSGYWKDVGTVESLYEANMDLLGSKQLLRLDDPDWGIYCRPVNKPPQQLYNTASVKDSMITDGCRIEGYVEHSVLFPGVRVEEGACVRDSVVFSGAVIRKGANVDRAILAEDCELAQGAYVGAEGDVNTELPKDPLCTGGISLVAAGVRVGAGIRIGREVSVCKNIPDRTEEEEA